jgi:diketogulonate reductase-like aldo/keto reductase
MDTTILNNGVQMPMLGFGVFQVTSAAAVKMFKSRTIHE